MWNITITKAAPMGQFMVVDIDEAKAACEGIGIEVVEPGDWDGDWLVELPTEMEEIMLNSGVLEFDNNGYDIHGEADKEW